MSPILQNYSTAEFLEVVDPGNLASDIEISNLGEQFVQHVEIEESGNTRTYQSQCELIAPGHIFSYLQDVTDSLNRKKALDEGRKLAEQEALDGANLSSHTTSAITS